MARTRGATTTIEGMALSEGLAGFVFYTTKANQHIGALAAGHGRRVRMRKVYGVVPPRNRVVILLEVEILE